MIDICQHNRFFIAELVEINGTIEYRERFPFMVNAGESLARVKLLIQVEKRNGVPQALTDPAEVDAYIADELVWEDEVGNSDLWFEESVCQPVVVRRELDEATYNTVLAALD